MSVIKNGRLVDAMVAGMQSNGMSFYGGSDLANKLGQESHSLRERAIAEGFTVRHEKGRVVIVLPRVDK